jgi:hypothetical protein
LVVVVFSKFNELVLPKNGDIDEKLVIKELNCSANVIEDGRK